MNLHIVLIILADLDHKRGEPLLKYIADLYSPEKQLERYNTVCYELREMFDKLSLCFYVFIAFVVLFILHNIFYYIRKTPDNKKKKSLFIWNIVWIFIISAFVIFFCYFINNSSFGWYPDPMDGWRF